MGELGEWTRRLRRDGSALQTAAIQRALDEAGNRGGGTVALPAGRILTGALTLRTGTVLRLEAGCTLVGSERPEDYPIVETRWEGAERSAHQPLLYARGAQRVVLCGDGTIDGRGEPWWAAVRSGALGHPRPRLVAFDACEQVCIENVRLINSPSWTVHPFACTDVRITGVRILNPPDSPNTDGVDPESCAGVVISDCRISVGDDCIAIKAGLPGARRPIPCERVLVNGCLLESGHGAVVVGSEMSGGVRDIGVFNCIFSGTDRGLRFKSRRGRGGTIENVRAGNLVMRSVGVPFAINLFYEYTGPDGRDPAVQDRSPRPVTPGTPVLRDFAFSSITARDTTCAAAFVLGLPEMPVQSLSFDDVSIAMAGEAAPMRPEMAVGVEPAARVGFLCSHVAGLSLNRVRVENQTGPAFVLDGVTGDGERCAQGREVQGVPPSR